VRLFSKAAEVRPDDYEAPALLGTCFNGLGRMDEKLAVAQKSIRVIEKHLELHPDDARAVYFGAGRWSVVGDREKALEWCRRALKMAPGQSGVRYNVACVYVGEGLLEEALDLLEQNVAERWGNRAWFENDPDMKPLQDHPRFRAILDKMPVRRAGESG